MMSGRLGITGVIVLVVFAMMSGDGIAAAKPKKADKGPPPKVAKAKPKPKTLEGTWTMAGMFDMAGQVMFYADATQKQKIQGKPVWPCHCNEKNLRAAVAAFAKKNPGFPKTLEDLFGKPVKVTVKTRMQVMENAIRFDRTAAQEWVSIELLPEKATR